MLDALDQVRHAAQASRVPPAYLLVGRDPAALGTTAQRIAAILVGAEKSLDLLVVNEGSVDEVRQIARWLALKPRTAPRRVVLLPQAELLGPPAQNALLKTLEEPPGQACLVLATCQPKTLLSTVRSRCQKLRVASEAAVPHDEALLVALRQAVLSAIGSFKLVRLAQELGADKDKADIGLLHLEIVLRTLLLENVHNRPRFAALSRAAARLAALPWHGNFNRTLAFEDFFFTLGST